MNNIQESAATSFVQRIDLPKITLSRRAPNMLDLLETSDEGNFTKQDFEKALNKVSRKIKK